MKVNDLKLSKWEEKILIEMVGKRFNVGRREITLITERFPNRIENKKYLIFLLEKLVSETRRISKIDQKTL